MLAHDLPRRVRKAMRGFRLFEPDEALLVVSGWPVDEEKIGPTPSHWKQHGPENDTAAEDMLLVLLGSLLGEPIGWSTQQDGRMVHDILPIKGHEQEQLGSGSEVLLTWHVEDAFHPYRGDYLGMMCLRNPDRVPTTFAPIRKVRLSPEQQEVLRAPHFTIRPDESAPAQEPRGRERPSPRGGGGAGARLPQDRADVGPAGEDPGALRRPAGPYIRLDPYFMGEPEDPRARASLEELTRQIDGALEDQVLEPGDFCFIDNFQAVHGRKPFKARYDGRDRWMKRINVVRDLRKSRESRLSAAARVLY